MEGVGDLARRVNTALSSLPAKHWAAAATGPWDIQAIRTMDEGTGAGRVFLTFCNAWAAQLREMASESPRWKPRADRLDPLMEHVVLGFRHGLEGKDIIASMNGLLGEQSMPTLLYQNAFPVEGEQWHLTVWVAWPLGFSGTTTGPPVVDTAMLERFLEEALPDTA